MIDINFSALDAGIIGLGLAYTISLAGVLQFCVRQSAEVENIVSEVKLQQKLVVYSFSYTNMI